MFLQPTYLRHGTKNMGRIYSFVKNARKTGIEEHWIKLITGKKVEHKHLKQIDSLLHSTLNSVPKNMDIDPIQPWARLTQECVTQRCSVHFEIPKEFREKLKKECLAKEENVDAAKQLYLKRMKETRHKILRKLALMSHPDTIPPVKVAVFHKDFPHKKDEQTLKFFQERFSKEPMLVATLKMFEETLDVIIKLNTPETTLFYDLYVGYKKLVTEYREEQEKLSWAEREFPGLKLLDENRKFIKPRLEEIEKLNTPLSNMYAKILYPYMRAVTDANVILYPTSFPSAFDIPQVKYMIGVMHMALNYDRVHRSRSLQAIKDFCEALDMMRNFHLQSSLITIQDMEERVPEVGQEVQRILMNLEFDWEPPDDFNEYKRDE